MTKTEAIDILVGVIETHSEEENEALDLAIEALKQPEIVRRKGCNYFLGAGEDTFCGLCSREDTQGVAESATTTDCISRADTIKAMCAECEMKCVCNKDCTGVAVVMGMPPVNQKQITGKLENAENATSEGEESTTGQPKSKLYIPLNQYTVERINRLHKNDCGDYFDEEWLYNELEQLAVLSPEQTKGGVGKNQFPRWRSNGVY